MGSGDSESIYILVRGKDSTRVEKMYMSKADNKRGMVRTKKTNNIKLKILMGVVLMCSGSSAYLILECILSKEYIGALFYCIVFLFSLWTYYGIKHEVKVNNRIDGCHELLKIQASVITDEYMKGMYNGMELILCTIEDRKPIWAGELDTNQREKGNLDEKHQTIN